MQENECVKHKNCGDCEYAFEHLIGYNYVCDIDAEPIELDQMRQDCPLTKKNQMNIDRYRLQNLALRKVKREQTTKPIAPCVKCGHESFLFDFGRPVTVKTCKNVKCKAVEVVSHA